MTNPRYSEWQIQGIQDDEPKVIRKAVYTLNQFVIFSGELAEQLSLADMVGFVKVEEEYALADGGCTFTDGNLSCKVGFAKFA